MRVILQETLKNRGKSQYWLAKQTGIAISTISNMCNGKTSRIEFSVLQKICDALDCEVYDIIERESLDPLMTHINKSDTE